MLFPVSVTQHIIIMLPLQLILDPSSLALSSMGNTHEDALGYIEELGAWNKLGSKKFNIAITSQETWYSLFEDKQLPDEISLQKRLLKCNVQEHDANDVIRHINNIIMRRPYLEEVAPPPQEEKIIPLKNDMHVQGPNMHRIFSRIIETLKRRDSTGMEQLSIIAQKIVKANKWLPEQPSGGVTVEAEANSVLLLAGNYQGFLQHINIAMLLSSHPFDEHELAIALQLIYDRYTGAPTPSEDIPHYNIGDPFIKRIHSLKPAPEIIEKLVTIMVETLLEVNLRDAHHLRIDRAGGAPPRKRNKDGALAWRRDIDREHHLHYWKGDGGYVEFAWFSFPHDDFECPE
ncbi:MAG: hypothetical protein HGB26_01945 [Desulfobulbaceae bacterium]|nr:hypothetical protein [Desulfobulbaceae bacterium]